jgi:putative transposase
VSDVHVQGDQVDPAAPGMPDEQLIAQLAGRARAEGLRLTGEDGLLSRLTKVVVEPALEGEMDDHLGDGKHDSAGRDRGNSRNGKRAKTVLTEAGPVEIEAGGGHAATVSNM